jgi:uncharacterized protein
LRPDFSQYGFPYQSNLIMSYLGGSAAHGAKLEDKADTDWYGVFIEPLHIVMGLNDYPHFTYTTSDGKGNTAEDVDVCLYSLRKWAGLAAKGNPSCLHFLFAPKHFTNIWWDYFEINKKHFVSKGSIAPFLGFANSQLMRLFGEKGQKNINRKELEEQHGYDTKYAMHVVRLFGEAKELMETGRITLPRPNKDHLIDIRLGKFPLSQIREMSRDLEAEALAARDKSPLQEKTDMKKISDLITYAQFYFHDWQRAKPERERASWEPTPTAPH